MAGDLEPVTAWAPCSAAAGPVLQPDPLPVTAATRRPDRGVDRGPQQHSYGNASAIHSPGWSSEPMGSTMYCLPPCM